MSYERYEQVGSVFKVVTDANDPYLDASKLLKIPTTISTPSPYYKTFFIKATTRGGIEKYQSFKVMICGLEKITSSITKKDYIYMRNSGTSNIQLDDVVNFFFMNENNKCPIFQYDLLTMAGVVINANPVTLSTLGS